MRPLSGTAGSVAATDMHEHPEVDAYRPHLRRVLGQWVALYRPKYCYGCERHFLPTNGIACASTPREAFDQLQQLRADMQ